MAPALLVLLLLGLLHGRSHSVGSSLGTPELHGPTVSFVGDIVEFSCSLPTFPQNENILLQLFKKGDREKSLGMYTSRNGEVAVFPKVIKLDYDGELQCVAGAQNNSNIRPTVSRDHYLRVVERVEDPVIDVTSGSAVLFEGERLELSCAVARGNYLSFEWLLDGRPVPPSSPNQSRISIGRASPRDSGSYVCVASNRISAHSRLHGTSSSAVVITVKAAVSKPEIWFAVLKEGPRHYFFEVTCRSSRGTPPIAWSLHNGTQLVANASADRGQATFTLPLVLGRHMGWFACQANNGKRTESSERIPVQVVPVGGPATISYDRDVGENYDVVGVRLYCQAARGSHPRFQWFLNKTPLHSQEGFYVVDQLPERSMLLLSVDPGSAGTYHCQVWDSFDNTTVTRSQELYIDREVLNRLPLLVQVVVFGCFTFLLLLVSFCCWAGVLIRRRQDEVQPLSSRQTNTVYESDLELSEFSEGPDTIWTVAATEFHQSSLDSEDEWLQIVKEKKTLEDGPDEWP